MLFAEFKTIEDYKESNDLAHKTLLKVKGYNSPMYASEKPLMSTKNTYLLPIIERFKKHLPFEGKEIEDSYIKVNEL